MAPKKHQSKSERLAKSSKGAAGLETGFISFSDVVRKNEESVQFIGPSPVYTGADPDLAVISKKLCKKNSSTRMKALSELRTLVEVCSSFFLHFLHISHRVPLKRLVQSLLPSLSLFTRGFSWITIVM
jgi:hypothetical protein